MEIIGAVFGLLLVAFVLFPIQVYEWIGPWWTVLLVGGIIVAAQGIRFVWARRQQIANRMNFRNN